MNTLKREAELVLVDWGSIGGKAFAHFSLSGDRRPQTEVVDAVAKEVQKYVASKRVDGQRPGFNIVVDGIPKSGEVEEIHFWER